MLGPGLAGQALGLRAIRCVVKALEELLPRLWESLGLPQVWGVVLSLLILGGFYLLRRKLDAIQAISAEEHKIRFSLLHDRRARSIEQLYADFALLADLANQASGRHRGEPGLGERLLETARHATEKFGPKRLLYSRELQGEIQGAINLAGSVGVRLASEQREPQHLADAQRLAEQLTVALNRLEREFQAYLFGGDIREL